MMFQDLHDSVRQKWPVMQEIAVPITYNSSIYRTYAADQDPKTLFDKATRYLESLRNSRRESDQQETLIIRELHDSIIHATFGSNQIEKAGLNLDITIHLCNTILRGEPIPDVDKYDIQGRREVVQHMRAFHHIIHHFVVLGEDMTEDLIKETHAILCEGITITTHHPHVPPEEYAGTYRDVFDIFVGAGDTMFVPPKYVPANMSDMCANLKKEIGNGFVEIHPFQDGNGRMCRMILNAILFRYTGIIVPIGEYEEDRDEYMGIKKRASRDMEGHGEYATFVLKKGAQVIRKLKKKLHGKRDKQIP
ncbi:filamentation induced by camp death on curing [Fusarium longipes]|uniref:Filamentation induced by camp death on curing n=1 Tax=Fusarium longipes TaxID=694270 RepID=A0A395SIT3_9HYPO|nr:filamentation induced by camp death on curing [Fusarium longipes]